MPDEARRISARKRRRSANDPDYSDEVQRRWNRRRHLPARQLHMAWLELADTIAGPAVRWIAARMNGGRHGNG